MDCGSSFPTGPSEISVVHKERYSSATIGRKNASGLSRDVDAVLDIDKSQDVDEEESDLVSPLLELEGALRRRGLSDSSIHSTFTSQAIIQIYHLPSYLPSPIGVPSFKP